MAKFSSKNVHLMNVLKLISAVCLLGTLGSSPSYGADQESVTQEAFSWLEDKRDVVSKNVTGIGRYLDRWLAGEEIDTPNNETYLRFKFDQEIASFDGYHSKVKVGGKIDLPQASERWKLIFDSDVDELNSLGDNRLRNSTSGIAIGGFSYQTEVKNGWSFNHDIGLRAKLPLDPFYRFKTSFDRNISDVWSAGVRQKIWYYESRGWGQDTRVYFKRALAENKFLRIESEITYRHDRNEIEFGQYISLNKKLGDMETLSYELGVLGLNEPNVRIDDYYVQLMYRKAVYEDWLILEISPQIVVSRDENWRPQSRFLLNLEVLFFNL